MVGTVPAHNSKYGSLLNSPQRHPWFCVSILWHGSLPSGRQSNWTNSHFYTADAAECESVKTAISLLQAMEWLPRMDLRRIAFYVALPTASACKSGQTPIYRSYNNGARGDPNHRYTPRPDVAGSMTERADRRGRSDVCSPGDGPPRKSEGRGGRRHAVHYAKRHSWWRGARTGTTF